MPHRIRYCDFKEEANENHTKYSQKMLIVVLINEVQALQYKVIKGRFLTAGGRKEKHQQV